jgi:large subunit ribosomal protein L21
MHAVIADGGKQYRVQEGDILLLEKKELLPGNSFTFEHVLALSDGEKTRIGAPYLTGVQVQGKVQKVVAGPKLIVFKFRRRKDSKVKNGHRQKYSKIQITKIKSEN